MLLIQMSIIIIIYPDMVLILITEALETEESSRTEEHQTTDAQCKEMEVNQ